MLVQEGTEKAPETFHSVNAYVKLGMTAVLALPWEKGYANQEVLSVLDFSDKGELGWGALAPSLFFFTSQQNSSLQENEHILHPTESWVSGPISPAFLEAL